MKILYLHQHFTTPKGASGTRSYEMAKRLIKADHQVTMVCGSFGAGNTGLSSEFKKGVRRGEVDGIEVIEFELPYSNKDAFVKRAFTFLHFALLNIKVVLKEPYDLIYATTTPLTVAVPALAAKWLRRKDFIFEVRDLWPELPKAMGVITNPVILKLMEWLETAAYKNAKACVGLSPGIVKGIKEKSPNKFVSMIPNSSDITLFSQGKPDSFRKSIGASEGDLVAIFSGTHGLANGLDALLETAVSLKSQNKSGIKIVLIGDGKLKPQLVEKSAQLGLNDYIIFHPPVSKIELVNIFTEVDVGLMVLANVSAFYWGTSPNKFFDYISAGLPVVVNYPGWVAEMVENNNLGKSVPAEDADAFANVLISLASNKEQLNGMSENSLSLAKSEFCRDKLAHQLVEFVEQHGVS